MTALAEVLLLAVVAGVTMLLARFLCRYLHFRKLEQAIPGPPSLPLLGNALDLINATPDTILQILLRLVEGHRKLSRLSILNHMIVVIQDPAEIGELLRRKEFNDKAHLIYGFLAFGAKNGLIQMRDAASKVHRKWLEPGFNKNVLDRFVDVFSEEAKGFVERVVTGKEVDVDDSLKRAVMRDFLRTSMTTEGSQFDDDLMEAVEMLNVFLSTVNSRAFNPFLWPDKIFALTTLGRKIRKMMSSFDLLIKRLIAEKRKQLKDSNIHHDSERERTLMDIMVGTTDAGAGKHMTEQDVTDEFTTFMAANVETTVFALSMVLKVLSMRPEVQDLVYYELVSVLGDREVTCGDLPELQFLDRVIKEVMRMFPPTPVIARQCYAETELGGYVIPAGSSIAISISSAHRHPEYWVKPEVFDPNRFLPEHCEDRHPCAYIPFSTGPRNCIGSRYAMMNMTTFLATTLRAFKVLPVDDHKDLQSLTDNMTFHVASRLVRGVRVMFQAREKQEGQFKSCTALSDRL